MGENLRWLGAFIPLVPAWAARIFHARRLVNVFRLRPMLFKLFRKPSESPPRFEQDASMAEALQRRVDAIQFQPSKGFLKDQQQPKRATRRSMIG